MRDFQPKQPCVYLLASAPNGILYAGVTSDLANRVSLHKQKLTDGFTKRYGVTQLVYYEMHETMDAAIRRESQIKKWKRTWKVRLIEQMNPEWRDLFDETTGEIFDGPADTEREHRKTTR
jgi:putative endonuclease